MFETFDHTADVGLRVRAATKDELLYLFESERFLPARAEVTLDGERLQGVLHGETIDWDHRQPGHEVKAITYHDLKIAPTADGWEAEVIVDI